jgi:hypothetical protein
LLHNGRKVNNNNIVTGSYVKVENVLNYLNDLVKISNRGVEVATWFLFAMYVKMLTLEKKKYRAIKHELLELDGLKIPSLQ